MTIRVLIADGSDFFCRRLIDMLDADPVIDVVDVAINGQEAIEKVKSYNPDIVAMDVDMPVMSGIEATRHIMQQCPTPVIIFTSFTHEGGEAALDALEAGTVDFLPKRFDDIARDITKAREIICLRIKTIAESCVKKRYDADVDISEFKQLIDVSTANTQTDSIAVDAERDEFETDEFDLIVIGASVGGPPALQQVLPQLPAGYPVPILLIQHMPGKFTEVFANRLNRKCKVKVREARNGDELEPGLVLVAPDEVKTKLEKRADRLFVKVEQESNQGHNYESFISIALESINEIAGKRILVIILSGVGIGSMDSFSSLKKYNATVWSQDEKSSIVYEMPGSVA